MKTDESLRERIIKAAFSAFMEQGYAGTSTLEIATRARVSKREIYAEFGSKQAVLAACIASRSQRVRLPAETSEIRSREDLAAALIQFGRTQLKELTDPAVIGVFRLAVAEAPRTPEVAQTLDETGRDAVRAALRDVMKNGLAAGLIGGAVPDMAGDFAALLFKGTLVDLMLGVAERPDDPEIDRRSRRAAEAFLKLYGV